MPRIICPEIDVKYSWTLISPPTSRPRLKKMSEETDNTKEGLRALRKLVEDQAIAFREFQEQQLATQVLQDQRIETQGQTIAQLNAEIAATAAAATAAVAPPPETVD